MLRKTVQTLPQSMKTWQIHQYVPRTIDEFEWRDYLKMSSTRRVPTICSPCQVLIKVQAASLNPIDLHQMKGYGSSSFKLARLATEGLRSFSTVMSEFPQTPGRDFIGEVVLLGPGAAKAGFQIGHQVIGATLPHESLDESGALSEYVLCSHLNLANLSHYTNDQINRKRIELAALPYAGLTAWAALYDCAGISPESLHSNLRVLIVGASGGVGYIAAQLLKQCDVKKLDIIIPEDEQAEKMFSSLKINQIIKRPHMPPIGEKYDFILDCVRPYDLKNPGNDWLNYLDVRKSCKNQPVYVNLNSPLLKLIDEDGIILGGIKALGSLLQSGKSTKWAFFKPSSHRLSSLASWLLADKINILIDSVYSFDQIPLAFNRFSKSGVRGKIVIDFNL